MRFCEFVRSFARSRARVENPLDELPLAANCCRSTLLIITWLWDLLPASRLELQFGQRAARLIQAREETLEEAASPLVPTRSGWRPSKIGIGLASAEQMNSSE